MLTARVVVVVVVGENKTHDIHTTPPQVKKKKKKNLPRLLGATSKINKPEFLSLAPSPPMPMPREGGREKKEATYLCERSRISDIRPPVSVTIAHPASLAPEERSFCCYLNTIMFELFFYYDVISGGGFFVGGFIFLKFVLNGVRFLLSSHRGSS